MDGTGIEPATSTLRIRRPRNPVLSGQRWETALPPLTTLRLAELFSAPPPELPGIGDWLYKKNMVCALWE